MSYVGIGSISRISAPGASHRPSKQLTFQLRWLAASPSRILQITTDTLSKNRSSVKLEIHDTFSRQLSEAWNRVQSSTTAAVMLSSEHLVLI